MPGRLARRLALSGMLSVGLVTGGVSAADGPPLDNGDAYSFEGFPRIPIIPLPRPGGPKTYNLGKRSDAHTFLSIFNTACANTRLIPATGSRAREACDGFSEWLRRGFKFTTVRGNRRLLEEYARRVHLDCVTGVINEDLDICKFVFKVDFPYQVMFGPPSSRPPLGPPPEAPPPPPRVEAPTVRVTSNCAVLEVTPGTRGVTTKPKDCAAQVLGDAVEQPAPPVPVEPPEIPDWCPAPSVEIKPPPPGVIGRTVASIHLKMTGFEGRPLAARRMEVEVERVFNQEFGSYSFELDVIINSTSPDATEFISLSYPALLARTGGASILLRR